MLIKSLFSVFLVSVSLTSIMMVGIEISSSAIALSYATSTFTRRVIRMLVFACN